MDPFKQLASEVARGIHAQRSHEAAQRVADFCKLDLKFNSETEPDKYFPVLQYYLHELLEHGGMAEAAQILWTPSQFTPEPQSVKDVWALFDRSPMGLIMGAAKLGKSFSMGVRLMLEWIRDPEWTSIRVIGPSENHLEENLFSHLVSLHSHASLPMPGQVGDLFIGLDRRNQLSSIRGVVIPKGNVKKAGRLQGGHRRPRKEPHPIFGALSRLYIFLDEIENVPGGIWNDISNVLSEIEKNDNGYNGFGIYGAYNPSDLSNEVAKRSEPSFGWDALDEDSHFQWKSVRGWDILRLDGERCENVIQGKIVFPGLQTREGLEKIAADAGGTQAAGYLTMGRGMYPRQGTDLTIVPVGALAKWKGEYIWLDSPQPVGASDLALDGGDPAVYTLGKWGLATGIKYPPSLEFPTGRTVMFKDERGRVRPRYGLQAEQQFPLEPGETVRMKEQNITVCKKAGVRPEFFACDATGHGRGTADLIKHEWSSAIHAVNYSEGASKDKIMSEDTKTCNEQYERMFTELWFATKIWGEFGYLLLSPKLDMSKLADQLTKRRYRFGAGRSRAESKQDYKTRVSQGSPNEADSLTLLVHAARKGSGVVLSMNGESNLNRETDFDDWPSSEYSNGVRIDSSNQTDYLNEKVSQEEIGISIL